MGGELRVVQDTGSQWDVVVGEKVRHCGSRDARGRRVKMQIFHLFLMS